MLTRYEPDSVARPEPSTETVWAQNELNQLVWGSVREAAGYVGKHYRTVFRLIEMNNPEIAYRKTDMGYIVYIPSVCKWYKKEFKRERDNEIQSVD